MSTVPTTIILGGSAGSLEVLFEVLAPFEADTPLAFVVVVHLLPGSPSHLAEVLGSKTKMRVREVDDGATLSPGTVTVAAPGYHLLVERDRSLRVSDEAPVHHARPSIDVTFESAADALGGDAVGVLLSGASDDGAAGLARLRARGGRTIVQAPETARVKLMPESGINADKSASVATPRGIAELLLELDAAARRTR
jgi:two-component system, chemotaxis family, protein-glutamate methylesterase/glutaminase